MFADRHLAEMHTRLRTGHKSAEAAKRLWPEIGETYAEIGGCSAVFAGDGSPLSQVNGFGFWKTPAPDTLEAIRAFNRGRTKTFEIVMNPFCVPEAWNMLFEAGVRLQNFESVLFRSTADFAEPGHTMEIEEVGDGDIELWGEVSTEAFFGESPPPFADSLKALIKALPDHRRYLALVDGKPAASASLIEHDGAAFLGGAAVLPEFRGQGIQRALIARRVVDSAKRCQVAFVEALPGSISQRNAEQLGFKLAFTQASMMLKP